MPKFIDLTARLKEGMIQNHYNHPRAPLLWSSQRHDSKVFRLWVTSANLR